MGWQPAKVKIYLLCILVSEILLPQTKLSLVASIKKLRPELLPAIDVDTTMAIPEEMPPQSVDKHVQHIEDIGEPITACFLTQMNTDPTNWYEMENGK